jgi:hypothetical protein
MHQLRTILFIADDQPARLVSIVLLVGRDRTRVTGGCKFDAMHFDSERGNE